MAKIELEAFYPYPIEHVWSALTESESLAQWLMENDFKPRAGHKFKMRAKPMAGWDGIARCEVIEIQKPYKLSWSQCGNDEGKDPFLITWTLKEEGTGTRLSLVHDGLKGLRGFMLKKIMGPGWKRMFDQRIPLVLEYASQKGWDQFPKDRRLVPSDYGH
jgi:uncharacterized protein YndB with AHSA1/START domain